MELVGFAIVIAPLWCNNTMMEELKIESGRQRLNDNGDALRP